MTLRRILMIASMAGFPTTASACRGPTIVSPHIYSSLPPKQEGEIAALVEFVIEPTSGTVIEAHIVSMLRGKYPGKRMVILRRAGSSCTLAPTKGTIGIVAGRLISATNEALVIETKRVPEPNSLGIKIAPIPKLPR